MRKSKRIDFLVLILLALAAVPTVIYFKANFLASTFLFLGVPCVYLLCRKTQNLKVVFSGVFLIGIILGFIFDFLATLNHAWIIPDEQLTFPYRVLGAAPIDELICLVIWTLLMLLVYEHFFERRRVEKIHVKHFICAGIIPGTIVVAYIILAFFFFPSLIYFKYAYLILGCVATIPLIYFAYQQPKMLSRIGKAAPYFIFLYFIFEITSLGLNQWSFYGEYIGHIQLFSFVFPLEELTFWILISSTVVLADYKLFIDTD
jgi:hypothetical protein